MPYIPYMSKNGKTPWTFQLGTMEFHILDGEPEKSLVRLLGCLAAW